MQSRLDPLEDLVGDLFVDRHEELAYFWRWATNIPSPFPHDSHALIGRRRTGKTTLMVKLFNRLYHEQEKVMPVYISFEGYVQRPLPQIQWGEFAEVFFASYVRSYLTFRYRQPIFMRGEPRLERVRALNEQLHDQRVTDWIAEFEESKNGRSEYALTGLASWVVNLPSTVAYFQNMPTVVMIDEFQVLGNAYHEQQKLFWGITSLFQKAAETHWAPLLVSGSVVATLKREIFGGALLGRFGPHHIAPLPREYAIELAFRLGKRRGVVVNEEIAEAIWQITGGVANSITGIMESYSTAIEQFPALDALEAVVDYELSNTNGKLLQYYRGEFEKYSDLLNGTQLTKRVMFWTTKYPDQPIRADQIANELSESIDNVQASLKKLHQIDVVSAISMSRYNGPDDPMLRRYIEYHHYVEMENLAPTEALKDWKAEYAKLQGTLNRFVGEVGEVYVQGVMQRFDGRTLDGASYFNHPTPVSVPKFSKVERGGGVVVGGVAVEIDLQGEWKAPEAELPSRWLVQVKNWKTPVGEPEVQAFLTDCDTLLAQKPAAAVVRWYFSKNGFSGPALALLQKEGVLYSDRHCFNQLAMLFDFTGLP